jgi:hypothetical protein
MNLHALTAAAYAIHLDVLDLFECVRRAAKGDPAAEQDAREALRLIEAAAASIECHVRREQQKADGLGALLHEGERE